LFEQAFGFASAIGLFEGLDADFEDGLEDLEFGVSLVEISELEGD
jgi:hypothetical protein